MVRRGKRAVDYYDFNLIAVILLLVGFGLIMLYSTTFYTSRIRNNGNDLYYFQHQAVISMVSLAAAILISRLDYHILWKLGGILYILALGLMAATRSNLGRNANGASRWVYIGGISFQPAELGKLAVIVVIPMIIVYMGRSFRTLRGTLVTLAFGALQAVFAYVFTQNLSTAVIIMGITVAMVFVAHPKTLSFILVGAACICAAAVILYFYAMRQGGSFRTQRVLVWLHPEEYSSDGGYQILQALYAIGSGGLFGKGLGNSTQKLGPVPEAENDMIFSIICEELGIVGGIIVILLFIYLLYRLVFIARNAPDLYGALMVTGIFAHIALQVVLNLCVVLNLMPTTGITLPFISYGGTSVVFLMMEMAIALSVSRSIRFRDERLDMWGEPAGSGRRMMV